MRQLRPAGHRLSGFAIPSLLAKGRDWSLFDRDHVPSELFTESQLRRLHPLRGLKVKSRSGLVGYEIGGVQEGEVKRLLGLGETGALVVHGYACGT